MTLFKRFLPFIFLLIHTIAFARSGESDLISTSANVNQLLVIVAQLLVLALFILGFGFIMISFSKYKKHKKMPTFVPLQTVVLMFLGGALMIGVGVIYIYTGEDVLGPDYLSMLTPASASDL